MTSIDHWPRCAYRIDGTFRCALDDGHTGPHMSRGMIRELTPPPVPVPVPVPEPEPELPRRELLEEAIRLTTGDRNNTYGPPLQDFDRTARLWTILFEHKLADGERFEPHDVSTAMIALKQSRSVWDPKRDNWADIAGYAGCGYECTLSYPEPDYPDPDPDPEPEDVT